MELLESTLATELNADQLIVDDREGQREAERRGIPVIGTLGVLRESATLKLLDIRVAAERLQATSFHVVPEVLSKLLKDFAWALAVTSADQYLRPTGGQAPAVEHRPEIPKSNLLPGLVSTCPTSSNVL